MWLTGLVAPQHVGSSQTRARTRVPCIGRQTPNHCATREAQELFTFLKCLSCIWILANICQNTLGQFGRQICIMCPLKFLLSWPNLYSALYLFPNPPCHPQNRVLFISYLNKQFDGFKKSFVSRFQHPNILELAAYFTESEKFCLVYPYMRNGSLFDRLQCVVSYIYYSA